MVDHSRIGKRSRRKGAQYERKIKKILQEHLSIELERTPQSGGFAKSKNLNAVKGDLNTLDDAVDFLIHTECKNWTNWAINEWWNQAVSDCPVGKIPILFVHQAQVIKKVKEIKRDGTTIEKNRVVTKASEFVIMKKSDFDAVTIPNKEVRLHIHYKEGLNWGVKKWWKDILAELPEGKLPLIEMTKADSREIMIVMDLFDWLSIVLRSRIIKEK